MSVSRTKTRNTNTQPRNINTHQLNRALADPLRVGIVEALGHAELSSRELAELLGINERLALYHVRILVHTGAVTEHHRGHHRVYLVTHPALVKICHILYELWAGEISQAHTHARVSL